MLQFKINDEVVYELSDRSMAIIQHDIPSALFFSDMVRRLIWIYDEKEKGSKGRILQSSLSLLTSKNKTVPADNEALIDLILADPDYKNRDARDAEEQAKNDAAAEALAAEAASEADLDAQRASLEAAANKAALDKMIADAMQAALNPQ